MNSILIGYLSATIYVAVSFLVAIFIYIVSKDSEYSRKTIHVLCGSGWIFFKIFFEGTIHPLIISCVLLLGIVILHIKKVRLVEREEQDNGTIIYGSSMVGMAFLSLVFPVLFDPFGIGIIGLAIGDGMASVFGKSFHINRVIYRNKTIAGTLACVLCAFIAFYIITSIFNIPLNLLELCILSLVAGVAELFGGKADNFVIPFSLFVVSGLMVCW